MTADTSRETQLVRYNLKPRLLEVVRLTRLSPRMRRVVLSGADLEADFPCVPLAPTEHVKVVFPDPETGVLTMPILGERGIRQPCDGAPLIFRDYTVRAIDRQARELVIDFVLHEHGVAGSWAARARVGDQVGVFGPRGSEIFPAGYDWYLIAGDETALPAISRWVEELPDTAGATVLVEVAEVNDQLPLASRPGIETTYLSRADTASPTPLEDAVRSWNPPSNDYFAWIAGEADTIKPIRRYFTRELGIPKHRIDVDGYWKRGVINHDHHAQDAD